MAQSFLSHKQMKVFKQWGLGGGTGNLGGRACQQVLRAKHLLTMSV